MKTSEKAINMIKRFEGCRLKAYRCPAGVWTIGYGHTDDVRPGDTISQREADSFLLDDIQKVEWYVSKFDKIYNFNHNQFDALVSFTFNCGARNLERLTQKGYRTLAEISAHLPAYCKAGGVVLAGLQRRRKEERILFDTPDEANKADQDIYYPQYKGDSPRIDEVLTAISANADYDLSQSKPYLRRKPIALANGFTRYTGSATQNNKLIRLAKDGKLRKV